jgi:hypothetical protein
MEDVDLQSQQNENGSGSPNSEDTLSEGSGQHFGTYFSDIAFQAAANPDSRVLEDVLKSNSDALRRRLDDQCHCYGFEDGHKTLYGKQ